MDYSSDLCGDTVSVSQTCLTMKYVFFCFFFCYSFLVGANNRTNVCETLHSLEASGGATTD